MKPISNNFLIVAILVLTVLTFGLIGSADYEDEIASERHYCEMVSQFNATKHLNRDLHRGHPDFKEIYSRACVKYASK